jgi:hypothetical protein
MNCFYALEDNKKKAMKYFLKLEEETNIPDKPLKEEFIDENFIFKHFYNNKKVLIK